MITQITDVPNNMVAFRADGEVTKEDFEVVKKRVAELVEATDKLNYLLYLDNTPADFTFGAWAQDALLGVKNIANWNRAAIISDSDAVKKFTDLFSKIIPGEFRGYTKAEYDRAVEWVSEQTEDAAYTNF
jgi:hypothetical protein